MADIRRRSVLCVPGSDDRKVAKAMASTADEVVVDLEDAVAIDAKAAARAALASLPVRALGSVAVRVNAPGTEWFADDVAAAATAPGVTSVVVPKVEQAGHVHEVVALLDAATHDRTPLDVQALIESPLALVNAVAIAGASPRLAALIIGYADLSASLGRRIDTSWQFAQDAVLLAARAAGIQAIDGPHLTIADDSPFAEAVGHAGAVGFDGKWAIHPQQLERIRSGFTPTPDEVADARDVVRMMEEAVARGAGAVAWRGRMLDEALVVAARRVIARSDPER